MKKFDMTPVSVQDPCQDLFETGGSTCKKRKLG